LLLEVRGRSEAIDHLRWNGGEERFVPPRQFEDFVSVLTAVNVVALVVCPAIKSDLRQRYGYALQELDSRGQKSKIVVPMRM
jgi:hypothetical protein